MVELPQENGKRRYFCKSLHTTNYYEAQEKAKIMKEITNKAEFEAKAYILSAKTIMDKMIFDEYEIQIESGDRVFMQKVKRISSKTQPDIIKAAVEIASKKLDLSRFSKQDQEFMKKFAQLVGDYLISQGVVVKQNPGSGSNHTIEEIMERMLKKAKKRKKGRTKQAFTDYQNAKRSGIKTYQ